MGRGSAEDLGPLQLLIRFFAADSEDPRGSVKRGLCDAVSSGLFKYLKLA